MTTPTSLGTQETAQLDPALVHRVTKKILASAPGASAIAIGLHHQGSHALVTRGHTTHHGSQPADEATRFEIGSLTKPFTALLLSEQVAHGELAHHEPLARHLPTSTILPPAGKAITLTHLATHTSGLPRLPIGLLRSALPHAFSNPYADLTADDVLRHLPHVRLRAQPGTRVRYSNYGLGLLGHALTGPAGTTYPTLLTTRVLHPLGLRDTDCAPTPPVGGTQATGYRRRRPRPPFSIPGMPAAGALRSSARDMLTLTEALIDPATAKVPSTLHSALQDVLRPRLRLPNGSGLALVWNTRPRPDGTVVYHHSGGTPGCTAFVGFNPHHRTALVALTNTASAHDLVQEAYNAVASLHQCADTVTTPTRR